MPESYPGGLNSEANTVVRYFQSALGDGLYSYVRKSFAETGMFPLGTKDGAESDREFVNTVVTALWGLCIENTRVMVLTAPQRDQILKGVSEAVISRGKFKSLAYDTSKLFVIATYLNNLSSEKK